MTTLQQWKVGAATVTAIVEDETHGIPPEFFFPESTAADVRDVPWLGAGFAAADGTIALRVQAFLVEMDGFTALVDPCVGNAKQRMLPFWANLQTPWLERFAETGVATDAVDLIVHTHLHADHVGWDTHLVDGAWVPTFTRARHVYVGDELDYWRATEQRVNEDVYGDSVAPVMDAGLGDVVAADTDLGHGLRLVPTPGHTPGHVSLEIENASDQFVVSGDLMHHPVQCARPEWAEVGDWDGAMGHETRHAFLDDCCARGVRVAGTHFPTTPVGLVVADKGNWRFDAV